MPDLDAASPLAAYRAAFEAGDVAGLRACLAPDATLKSPITDDFEFAGRDQIAAVMEEVVAVVSQRRFHAEIGDGRGRVLKGSGVVGGVAIDESIHFRLDAAGLIERIELYVRPMPGLVTLAAVLGPRIAGRASPARGAAVRVMLAPLAFMTRRGEKLGARLARP
ncbi:MAG TPA: nuclear transport factor 2 family protein [Conexibacter sp.]|nr:nuclear transport factor 2 family protein [Conexibacter sp.]